MSGFDDPSMEPVTRIGRALGLLDRGTGSFSTDWFKNPLTAITTSLHTAASVEDLFLAVAALGHAVPDADDPSTRRFPIDGTSVAVLLKRAGAKLTVGVGVQHAVAGQWSVGAEVWVLAWDPTTPNNVINPDDLDFTPTARAEISVTPAGPTPPLTSIRGAIETRVSLTGAGASPVDGDVSIELAFTPPGGEAITLAWNLKDTLADPIQHLVPLAVAAVLGLLRILVQQSAAGPLAVILRGVVQLMGAERLADNTFLPSPDVSALLQDAPRGLQSWAASLFNAAPDRGKAALETVATILSGGAVAVSSAEGDASAMGVAGIEKGWTAGWAFTAPAGVRLTLGIIATRTVEGGVPTLHLGARLGASRGVRIPAGAGNVDADFDLVALAESFLLTIPLAGAASARFDGTTRLLGLVNDRGAEGDHTLVSVDTGGVPVSVEGFEGGVSFAPGAHPTPVLALTDVRAPAPFGDHERFDLLDLDNAAKLGAAVGAGALLGALALAGVDLNALAATGKRVGALLGLLAPEGAPAGYPVVDAAKILQDPSLAWREWLAKMLVESGGARPFDAWLTLLHDALKDLTGNAAFPAVTGHGTVADPYAVQLHTSAPAVALRFSLPPAPAGRLAIRVEAVASVDHQAVGGNTVELDSSVVFGLLDTELPAPVGGAGSPSVAWVPGVHLEAAVSPVGAAPFSVSVPAPANLAATVADIDLRFGWDRADGLRPDLLARDVHITRGGAPVLDLDELSLKKLIEGDDPTLPAAIAVATSVGLAAVSAEAADRSLAVARLLGFVSGAVSFGAVDLTRFKAILQDPGTQLPKLWLERLVAAAWTSGPLAQDGVALPFHLLFGGAGDPARRPPVSGAGTEARPWAVSLRGAGTSRASLELLTWLGPSGPASAPAAWVDAVVPTGATGAALVSAMQAAAAFDGDIAGAALGVTSASLPDALRGVGGALGVGATAADVVTALRARLSTLRTTSGTRAAPDRVGLGLALRTLAATNGITVTSRLELGLVALSTTAAAKVQPQFTARFEVTVARDGGWLLGSAAADTRLRAVRLSLRWSAADGFGFDSRFYDVRVRGLGADVITLDDVRAGAALEALRDAEPGLFVAAGAAGALAGLLAGLGLASEVAGTFSLLAGPVGRLLAPQPGDPSPSVQLRDALLDPATGAPRMALFGPVLERLGARTAEGATPLGLWRFDLGTVADHALSVDVLPDATLRFSAGAADKHVDAQVTLAPLAKTLAVDVGAHPVVQGNPLADLRFQLHTVNDFANPTPTLRLLPLRDPAPALLGSGLSLVPPQSDLTKKLLEILGMAAAGLFVRFVVEARLFPVLPNGIFDLFKTFGLVAGTTGAGVLPSDRRVADLSGLLADPAGFFTTPEKLAQLVAGFPTSRTIGPFKLALEYDPLPATDGRALRLVFANDGGATVFQGDLGLQLRAGLTLDLPEASGRPRGIAPFVDSSATARFGAGGPSLGLRVGVTGAEPSFALLVTPSGVTTPAVFSLLPWAGLGDTLRTAAEGTLLPLALAELVKKLTSSTSADVQKVGDALAQLLSAIGAAGTGATFTVDGAALIAFVHDPQTAWKGLYDPAVATRGARVTALQRFVSDLLGAFGGPAPTTANGVLTVPIGAGGPVSVKLGVESDGRLGLALAVSAANFPTRVVTLDGSRVGVKLSTTDGKPEVESALAVGLDLDLGTLTGGSAFHALLRLTGAATTSGAFTLSTSVKVDDDPAATPDAIDVLTIDILPTFAVKPPSPGALLANLDSPTLVLAEVVLPTLLLVLTVPAVAGVTLDVELVPATLRIGDLLLGARLIERSGARWLVVPRAERPSVILAILGALSKAAELVTGLPIRPASTSLGLGAGLRTNQVPVTLLDRPQVSLLRGWSTSAPATDALTAYLLGPGATLTFRPGLVANGFGVKIAGNDGGALLDSPFGLGAIELRTQLRLVQGLEVRVGAAVTLTDLRFGMGGSSTPSDNPVASSLFSERSTSPGFGLQLGYTWGTASGTNFVYDVETETAAPAFELSMPGTAPGQFAWVNVNAKIGPLEIQRFGVKLDGAARISLAPAPGVTAGPLSLSVGFDARFSLGPLTVECWGLGFTVDFNPNAPPPGVRFRFNLDGLAAMYSSGGIVVAGAFLKVDPTPPNTAPEYIGAAVVRVPSFELQAVGAYTTIKVDGKDQPSFFIFARVNVAIGGPPFFFIMGFAGGFGFNRSIVLPRTLADVQSSSFMQLIGSSGDLVTRIRSIAAGFPAKPGAYWLAAGVNFRSFVLIEGTALLYVLLDDGFTLGLIGRAAIQLPTASNAILSLVLALDAGFSTTNDDPRLWVTALLTDESFLVHPDVKITGGFALFIWFKRGDFVLSIGGYCNKFKKPDHYPDVPRVGVRWQLGSAITIKGGVYFALTPRLAMGGVEVSVNGEWGPAKAWLNLQIDMMIGWDPFFYYFRASIEIGGSIDLWLCEPEFSLSAEIEVQGPEFGGHARVEICGIGVTIRFGARDTANQDPVPLPDWTAKAFDSRSTGALPGLFALESIRGRFAARGDGGKETSKSTDDHVRGVLMESTISLRTKLPATEATLVAALPVGVAASLAGPASTSKATAATLDLAPSKKDDAKSRLTLTLTPDAGNPDGVVRVPRARYHTGAQPVALYEILPKDGGDPKRVSVQLIEQLEVEMAPDIVRTPVFGDRALTSAVDEDVRFRLPLARAASGDARDFDAFTAALRQRDLRAVAVLSTRSARARERIAEGTLPARLVLPSTWGMALGAAPVSPPIERAVAVATPAAHAAAPRVRALFRANTVWPSQGSTRTVSTVARVEAARTAPRVTPPAAGSRGARVSGIELVTMGARTARPPAPASLATVRRSRDPAAAAQPEQALREGRFAIVGGDVLVADVPRGARGRLETRGDQSLRVVMLSVSSEALADVDLPAGDQTMEVPAAVTRVVVQGLGRLDDAPERSVGAPAAPRAALPSLLASHARGAAAVLGFDADHPLAPVGEHAWLARGAVLRVVRGNRPGMGGAVRVAADVLADATEVEMRFGGVRGSAIVTAIRSSARVARGEDALAVTVNGRAVTARTVEGVDGRVALVFELPTGGATTVAVEVSSGWLLTGVMAAAGTTDSWVSGLAARRQWNLVEDGPPGSGGRTTLHLENVS